MGTRAQHASVQKLCCSLYALERCSFFLLEIVLKCAPWPLDTLARAVPQAPLVSWPLHGMDASQLCVSMLLALVISHVWPDMVDPPFIAELLCRRTLNQWEYILPRMLTATLTQGQAEGVNAAEGD